MWDSVERPMCRESQNEVSPDHIVISSRPAVKIGIRVVEDPRRPVFSACQHDSLCVILFFLRFKRRSYSSSLVLATVIRRPVHAA